MPPDDEPFSMTPTPSRDQSTKHFVIRLAATVVALLVLGLAALFGTALYQGTTSIPEAVQTQIWVSVAALLTIGSTAVAAWVNARNAARIRDDATRNALFINEAAAREAVLLRANSNRNAVETQAEVVKVVKKLEDGFTTKLSETTATIVDENTKRTTDELAKILETSNVVRDAERRAREIIAAAEAKAATIALGAKIDAVSVASPPVAPAPVLPPLTPAAVQAGVQAIETNTAATELVAEQLEKIAQNTASVEANTTATDLNSEARKNEGASPEAKP